MTRPDLLAVVLCAVAVLALGLGGAFFLGPTAGLLLALSLAAAALLGAQLASHRVLKARMEKQDERARSLEALVGLYATLGVRAPLPAQTAWSAAPDFLAIVAETVREKQPRLLVECGSGASTLVAGYAMEKGHLHEEGRIVSLDHEAEFAQQSRGRLARHGLDRRAKVRHAPLAATPEGPWYDPSAWSDLHDIDLLVVDGPPTEGAPEARYPALPLLLDRLAPGAVILVDDADRPGERAVVTRWHEEVPGAEIARLPTVRGTVVIRMPEASS